MNKRKVYKVVRKDDTGKLISANAPYFESEMAKVGTFRRLVYKRGKITRPYGNTRIFVFKRKVDAKNWLGLFEQDYQIWEAEGHGVTVPVQTHLHTKSSYAQDSAIFDFWNGVQALCTSDSLKIPTGTLFCEKVKLVRKLKF